MFERDTLTSFDFLSRLASPVTRFLPLTLGSVSPSLGSFLRLGSVPAGSTERETIALRGLCDVRSVVYSRFEMLSRMERSELKRLPLTWAAASRVA